MQTLKNKKGFSMIEVMCSITIFTILFMSILTIYLTSYKLKTYSEKLDKYTFFMEELKNNIMYNYNGEEIEKIKTLEKRYIPASSMKIEALKEKSIDELLVKEKPEKPYVEININSDINDERKNNDVKNKLNKIFKIKLNIYGALNGKPKEMECEFYKGSYEKQ